MLWTTRPEHRRGSSFRRLPYPSEIVLVRARRSLHGSPLWHRRRRPRPHWTAQRTDRWDRARQHDELL